MIGDKRVLAVVPARGGSKGIPGKNLKVIAGRSLLHRTLDQATKSSVIDEVVVSSDDAEFLRHATEISWASERSHTIDLGCVTQNFCVIGRHHYLIDDAGLHRLVECSVEE